MLFSPKSPSLAIRLSQRWSNMCITNYSQLNPKMGRAMTQLHWWFSRCKWWKMQSCRFSTELITAWNQRSAVSRPLRHFVSGAGRSRRSIGIGFRKSQRRRQSPGLPKESRYMHTSTFLLHTIVLIFASVKAREDLANLIQSLPQEERSAFLPSKSTGKHATPQTLERPGFSQDSPKPLYQQTVKPKKPADAGENTEVNESSTCLLLSIAYRAYLANRRVHVKGQWWSL